MTDQPHRQQGDTPRNEPEVFPPGTPIRPRRRDAFDEAQFTQRIYVRKLGPFSLILLVAAIAIVAVVVLALLLGAFLISIPVIMFLVAVAMIAGVLRPHLRRRS